MVVEHTIDAFESNPHIDEIAIVSNPFYIADFESIIIKKWMEKSEEDSERRSRKDFITTFRLSKLTKQRMST